MLDRLRTRLGDQLFAKVLRAWPQTHRDANATRGDWIAWLNRTTGRDLTGFVTRWLTSPTTPG